jgi:hypothetical protein
MLLLPQVLLPSLCIKATLALSLNPSHWVKRVVMVADAAAGAVGTDAIVAVVSGIIVAVYGVVINAAVTVVMAVVGDLHWLWLCYRGSVGLIYL